jgi:hypothetical protein
LTALTLIGWIRRRQHALVGAMVVQGFGLAAVALAPTLPWAMAGFAVSGGGFLAAITRSTVRLQAEVPEVQLGRVMALWSLAFIGTRPLAALLDGVVAELIGARGATVVLALPVLAAAPWVHRRLRADAARTTEAADAAAGAADDQSPGAGSSVAR